MELSERDFIASPEQWPRWPRLAMVRRKAEPRDHACGYLVDGMGFTVYLGFVFDPTTGQSIEYQTLGELLTDWRID